MLTPDGNKWTCSLTRAARSRSFSDVTKTRSARRNSSSSLATMRLASAELDANSSTQ